jgi:hypothetical protein
MKNAREREMMDEAAMRDIPRYEPVVPLAAERLIESWGR